MPDVRTDAQLVTAYTAGATTSTSTTSTSTTTTSTTVPATSPPANGPSGELLACQWNPPTIYVEYVDESAVVIPASVEWSGALSGASELADRAGIAVYGEMDVASPAPGAYSYVVNVSDVRGIVGTLQGFFTVRSC